MRNCSSAREHTIVCIWLRWDEKWRNIFMALKKFQLDLTNLKSDANNLFSDASTVAITNGVGGAEVTSATVVGSILSSSRLRVPAMLL